MLYIQFTPHGQSCMVCTNQVKPFSYGTYILVVCFLVPMDLRSFILIVRSNETHDPFLHWYCCLHYFVAVVLGKMQTSEGFSI